MFYNAQQMECTVLSRQNILNIFGVVNYFQTSCMSLNSYGIVER